MPDVLSGYTWDRSARRYRSQATGRYVARNTVVGLLESHVNGGDQRIEALTTAFYEGRIAPSVFAEQMRTQLKRLHLQNAALGAGGWDRLTPADYGRVGQRLRTDYARITRLANDVQSGSVSLPQALNRTSGYVGNSRIAFWETDRAAQVAEPGMVIIERRVISARESCRDCLNYYAMGWQPVGVLPVPGVASACQTHCRCRMERRQVPATEIGAFVKKSPAQVIVEEDAKRAEIRALGSNKFAGYLPSKQTQTMVRNHVDGAIQEVAVELGVTPTQVEAGARRALDGFLRNNEIAVQVRSDVVDRILDDGRFKSTFETNSKAIFDADQRRSAEDYIFGIPPTITDKQRPIYGYVRAGLDAERGVRNYGNLSVVLKDEVKRRSTITVDDSLSNGFGGRVAGSPLLNPDKVSWDDHVGVLYSYSQSGNSQEFFFVTNYIEVQIQNGVSVDDIAYVIDRSGALTQAQISRLQASGIRVEAN